MINGIVVHDPLGELADGTILGGPGQVVRARDSGAIVLPCETAQMFDAAPIAGYFRRGWGHAGWRVGVGGGRICPMMIRVIQDLPWIYWAAWIVPAGPSPSGRLHLISDTLASGVHAGSLVAGNETVLVEDVPPAGIAIGGRRRVSVRESGFMSLAIYAMASNIAVLVSAVSQTRIDVAYP